MLDAPPIPAAVLVPVVLGEPPGILLTKRTAHLNKHAGQVSFPGGRIDPGDNARGRRAARGRGGDRRWRRATSSCWGGWPTTSPAPAIGITPVLGLLPPGLTLHPSPHEVEAVFELPIDVLLDPDAPQRQRQHVRGDLAGILGLAASGALHLGRDRGDPGASGAEAAK